MNLMLPSARRQEGGKQPCIKVWKFDIRIPFVHYEWEIPEMIQACVVFLTGTAATQYLQDLFGFTFEMALSIVFVHELLYVVNNTMGDPLIGGWITPAVPLITTFLLNFEGTDRMYALVGMALVGKALSRHGFSPFDNSNCYFLCYIMCFRKKQALFQKFMFLSTNFLRSDIDSRI